ncbi:PilW family protein [Thiohalomonas denitrificans]|uniref:PilW family protein n=1 Tax=Thiohalomonas denitrificans TaxID=415747 RepID=UPI0026F2DF6C|nr:hypothetical protein [Thiohalomonas denitrificans]
METSPRIGQLGLSLVELMIGLAVGLIVTAAVTSVYIMTIKSNSETLKAANLSQQLRSVAMVITSDVRRAGYWYGAKPDAHNPFTVTGTNLNILDGGKCILYTYDRNADGSVDSSEYFGFKKNGDEVWMKQSGANTTDCTDGNWQGVTDDGTVIIDDLIFTTLGGKCQNTVTEEIWTVDGAGVQTDAPCEATAASSYTAPVSGDDLVEVRRINVTLTGHLESDSAVIRTVTSSIKVRNDRIYSQP